jgi:uncharacterized protein (UPF0332 family)
MTELSSIEEVKMLLEKSKRKLKRAREAFNDEDYDSALGDAYRSVELTMRALLISRGITRLPKTHGGLLQLFAQNLVETKAFPRELAKKIGKLASYRARADYEPIFTRREEAEEAIKIGEDIFSKAHATLKPST